MLQNVRVLILLLLVSMPVVAKETTPFKQWKFDGTSAGWRVGNQVQLQPAEKFLRVRMTGGDPFMFAKVEAAAGWNQLVIKARFRGRRNAQLFWITKKAGTSEQRSVRFQMRSNNRNQWRTFKTFFHTDNPVTEIRLDPHNRRGQIEIAYIALVKKAPPAPQATPVNAIRTVKGFKVELLYSVPSGTQGSWVSMTSDPKGRLITSDQYGKLYRITPPALGTTKGIQIEPLKAKIGHAQGLLYAFNSLYVMVNGPGAGLYRLQDTNNDDQFDEVSKLIAIRGGGEHGPHAVVLSPDGTSLYFCAGNHTDLVKTKTSRVPRVWKEDLLLPRMWDAGGHAVNKYAPGGWICKCDPNGKNVQLVSVGYRNEYDIAFNVDGELFTYDADMEWDIGAPWYRPTRVCHVTSGSEFGWRSGTGKWPAYYPDSLPAVVDIGPGSPTGIVFGTGAKFPAKYQRALFINDWSYGVMYAVHFKPQGSSYVATRERFISAAPLPLTDLVINPKDGAMYFAIGGRRTQSGLYRVTYVGNESTAPAIAQSPGVPDRLNRRLLESLHRPGKPEAVKVAWKFLGSKDRFLRSAARIAIEHQPVKLWQKKALAEKNPQALLTAMVALARHGKNVQPQITEALGRLSWKKLSYSQQLSLLRVYGLMIARMGKPQDSVHADLLKRLDHLYPASDALLNRELCQLLVYLKAPKVIPRTLKLLKNSPTQQQQVHLALSLRTLKEGWTLKTHREYFTWFNQAAGHRGGHSFSLFLRNIRNEAKNRLTADEKKALGKLITQPPVAKEPGGPVRTKFVKKWKVADLLGSTNNLSSRNYKRGRKMFAAAACYKCHRVRGEGGSVGPDLTGAGRRFNAQNLLESLIEPSKVISDQYQATTFVLDTGKTITGRVVNLSGKNILVSENMLDPGRLTAVNRDLVERVIPSKTSLMPTGLLDTLNREEILDLIAFLQSGGDSKHKVFSKD